MFAAFFIRFGCSKQDFESLSVADVDAIYEHLDHAKDKEMTFATEEDYNKWLMTR